ncbi:hypothetical protein [Alloprevotella sp. OH1205_COT-284]|uniref:hypothetical protein n=1 Tax=Alloprevotella sp. OH1205_COT-284 TaxID=2491043 RepID=UPI000F5E1A4F|nr:hypothetical protein [Alloprevotella sp. OH1205_COT-284]
MATFFFLLIAFVPFQFITTTSNAGFSTSNAVISTSHLVFAFSLCRLFIHRSEQEQTIKSLS